ATPLAHSFPTRRSSDLVITGRVTDAENKPVVEERVSLQSVDENGAPSRFGVFSSPNDQMYQTDDRGIYRIYGLPAGRYKVSVGRSEEHTSELQSPDQLV